MPQHEDPFIYNAITGLWQNASNPATSGSPFGLTVGPSTGSNTRLTPQVGDTIQIDGGSNTATIESAVQMFSGANSEINPSYIASIVFSQGLAAEQIGTLIVAGFSNTTARGMILLSKSADGTLAGSARFGDVAFGAGPPTWAFTSTLRVQAGANNVMLGSGYQLVATNPSSPGNAETWHQFNPLSNSWVVPSSGYANYRLTPSNELQISAWIQAPATSMNSVTIATFPAAYRPTSKHGIPCGTDGIISVGGGNGFFTITNAGVLQSTDIAASSNCYIEAKIPLDV